MCSPRLPPTTVPPIRRTPLLRVVSTFSESTTATCRCIISHHLPQLHSIMPLRSLGDIHFSDPPMQNPGCSPGKMITQECACEVLCASSRKGFRDSWTLTVVMAYMGFHAWKPGMNQSMAASTQMTVAEASRYLKKKCTLLDLHIVHC